MENLKKQVESLIALYRSRNYSEAESFCKKIIASNPQVVILYNILGMIQSDQQRYDEAIVSYNKGIETDPNFALIYSNLGNTYKAQNNFEEAEKNYRKSISLDNKIPEPHNNLGNLLRSVNKYKEALESYKKAIEINDKFFWAHYNLATTFTSIGSFSDAVKSLEKTIKLSPYFCTAHRSLSRIKKYEKNDKHLSEMKNLYKNKKLEDFQKKELAFALGKAHEDTKDFESSYEYYKNANHLHRKQINFSIKNEEINFNEIKKIYSADLFNKFKKSGCDDARAIFIVGMPRSGTTLIEQIISNHPKVFGCDELNDIPLLQSSSKDILNMNNDDFKALGQKYINSIKKISNNSEIITDKLPINFKWLGFIKLILPNSKIIHCIRNFEDNCFSIYKNYFSSPNINFAYDMEEIIKFYKLYSNIMDHWRKVLPGFFYDIRYEKITKDPDPEIKKLIKQCGLTWNERCLEFHKNKRPIKTASDAQARKKIYSSSVDSWKNYKDNLKKFFTEN